MSKRKVGVYICHCGGNISDHVDVEKVRERVEKELGVEVARTTMFTCSDASQNEIMEDIRNAGLDGMVVASCSPKLHLLTFRGVADRSGLNPFQYVHVNIREQCSWAHSDDRDGATEKAIGLVLGGVEKVKLTEPLEPIRVNSVKRVLVIGAGIAGLRAAVELADLGVDVFLIERESGPGGMVGRLGRMYPSGRTGREIISSLVDEVRKRENITLFTGARLAEKEGYIGNFDVKIEVSRPGDAGKDTITLNIGAIIVTTGFSNYIPGRGEYGYGLDGVVTLPEFEEMLSSSNGGIVYKGKNVRSVAYIYCVGSREPAEREEANRYCSRYCCNAAVHTSTLAKEKVGDIAAFHLFRDVRTYGKFELLYEKASSDGAVFVRFDPKEPPAVNRSGDGLLVSVRDLLTGGEEIGIEADLVVLVTGMVPAENGALTDILRIPLGSDRFYNEIHTKLRPVETVIDGVYIGGSCQGPKNSSEAIVSSLSAVSKAASLLVKGYVDLQPFVAFVEEEKCEWCGQCEPACPYSAIEKVERDGREIAGVTDVLCKGCGACLPVCPADAIQLKGYTDGQIMSMIEAFSAEVNVD